MDNVVVISVGKHVYTVKFGEKSKGFSSLMNCFSHYGFIMSPEIREGMMTDKDGNVYFWDADVCEALEKTGCITLKPSTTIWEYCDERLPKHKRLFDKIKKLNKKNNQH